MSNPVPHVVIVGGGFAGLNAAKALCRSEVRITVVDRANHHLFQPLLYQVASAALNPSDIAAPIRSLLGMHKNTRVILAEAIGCDVERKQLKLREGALSYDYLIVAAGATHSYFGKEEWAPVAPGLKTVEDALDIRRRVLLAYEAAEREADPEIRRAWMTFVIIGGGPTGTELAGALSEIARHALTNDFRSIKPGNARVILVQKADRVLPSFPEELSAKAHKQLEDILVEVKTHSEVTDVTAEGVTVNGEFIAAKTVVWAAGVAASPLGRELGAELDRSGRVIVEPDLSIPGHPEVFVIGDMASLMQDGEPVFGVASSAIQAGIAAAQSIKDDLANRARTPFHYHRRGSMATIGRSAAVAEIGKMRLSGFPAWLAWGIVHMISTVGFRSRASVMLQWTWSYITYQRGVRLITGNVLDYTSPRIPLLLQTADRSPDIDGNDPIKPPASESTPDASLT